MRTLDSDVNDKLTLKAQDFKTKPTTWLVSDENKNKQSKSYHM